jgi:hypothetical protein
MAAAVLTLLGAGFLPILGCKFEWVTTHWIAGLVLAALVAWHIVRASFWLDFWSMVVGFDDMRSGWRAVGQAFGRKGPPPPKPGKYSLLQKLYHLAVAGLVLALVATGLLMLLEILAATERCGSVSALVLKPLRHWRRAECRWSPRVRDIAPPGSHPATRQRVGPRPSVEESRDRLERRASVWCAGAAARRLSRYLGSS